MTPKERLTLLREIRALSTLERHAFLRAQAEKAGLTLQQARQNVADSAEWATDGQLGVFRALTDLEVAQATLEHFADLVVALSR